MLRKIEYLNLCLQTTVMKKKMYYNMRIKTVHRNLSQVIAKMDIFQQHMLNFPHERLRALVSAMKEVSQTVIGSDYQICFA